MNIQGIELGELIFITKGRKADQVIDEPVTEAKRYIQIDDLRSNDNLKFAVDPSGVEIIPSDICIAWDGANSGTVGYGLSGFIGSTLARLRPVKKDLFHTPFVGRFLQSKFRYLNEGTKGATIPHISKDKLIGLQIHLPPLAEQCRIAVILDKADAIRQKRQESIRLTNEFLHSTFLEMFGDPGTNPKKWDSFPISELLIDRPNAIRTGPFGSQLRHSEFIKEGVPVLAIDNIVTNEFKWTEPRCLPRFKYEAFKRYRVFPRDVIVTIMGTTGRAAVAPDDLPECMSTKHLCVMTLNQDKVDSFFIWATLIFDQTVKRQASLAGGGAIMEGWNMSIISNLHVRVPPLPEQKKFSNVLYKLKENQKSQKKLLDSSEVLFNSLIHHAFRGELQ